MADIQSMHLNQTVALEYLQGRIGGVIILTGTGAKGCINMEGGLQWQSGHQVFTS